MKVAIIILAVAIVGAFAQTTPSSGPPPFKCDGNAFLCKLKEIGHHIKYHAVKLGGQLKKVGSAILSSALDSGKKLLANGAQAVLGSVLNHLNKEGLVGKREELSMFDKIKAHIGKGFELLKQFKGGLHAAFKSAVEKLIGIAKGNAELVKVDADADKKVDEAVEEYNKAGKKGFFGMAMTIAGKIKEIFKAGLDTLREKFAAKKVEERAILSTLSAAWEAAKKHLAGLASSVASTFKPHVDALKQGIATIGAKVKEHAGNLLNAAKAGWDSLKGKLSGHIDTLKGHAAKLGGHAVNAFNALKDAIGSIAKQALGNASSTIKDIVKTGTDAAKTAAGHIANAVGY